MVKQIMGYAHAKGVLDFLKPYLAVGNTFGNFYVIAPDNAKGHETSIDPIYRLDVTNFESVFQYGSNFKTDISGNPIEGYCRRDGVAPQIGINGLNERFSVFIPSNSKYKWMRDFVNAHLINNYTWLFTSDNETGKIKRRNF